jgi:hypothetical protein
MKEAWSGRKQSLEGCGGGMDGWRCLKTLLFNFFLGGRGAGRLQWLVAGDGTPGKGVR